MLNCNVDANINTLSDHNVLYLSLKILANAKKPKPKKHINWLKLINLTNRVAFNDELKNIVDNCIDLEYKEYCRYMVKATSTVVKEDKVENNSWYEHSKEILNPLIEERKKLLMKAKECEGRDEGLIQKCRDVRNSIKNTISIVKGR